MRPNAGVARRAAIPRDPGDPGVRSRIDPEGAEVDIRRVYPASPTLEPTYDIEWYTSLRLILHYLDKNLKKLGIMSVLIYNRINARKKLSTIAK